MSQAEALWESKSQIAGLACQDTRYKGPVYQTARQINNNNQPQTIEVLWLPAHFVFTIGCLVRSISRFKRLIRAFPLSNIMSQRSSPPSSCPRTRGSRVAIHSAQSTTDLHPSLLLFALSLLDNIRIDGGLLPSFVGIDAYKKLDPTQQPVPR
jgi:hypothetical protein